MAQAYYGIRCGACFRPIKVLRDETNGIAPIEFSSTRIRTAACEHPECGHVTEYQAVDLGHFMAPE